MSRPSARRTVLRIAFDGRRAFLNRRGLGSHSRTLLDLLARHAPEVDPVVYTTRRTELFRPLRGEVVELRGALGRLSMGLRALREGCRIFHGLSAELPPLPRGLRGIVTVHDLLFLRRPGDYRPWDILTYLLRTLSAVRRADLVLAISESTARDLVRFLRVPPARIFVLHQACNEAYFRRPPAADIAEVRRRFALPPRFLLYVGAVIPAKNLEVLLRALALLGADAPPLVVAGDGRRHRRRLERLGRRLGVSDRVVWTMDHGPVGPRELAVLYRSAEALVLPSRVEGFGLPVVEAMACGTPVVCSDADGLREAADGAALLFDPEAPRDLASKLRLLLADRLLRAALVARGLRRARRLRPERVAASLVAVYRAVADGRHPLHARGDSNSQPAGSKPDALSVELRA